LDRRTLLNPGSANRITRHSRGVVLIRQDLLKKGRIPGSPRKIAITRRSRARATSRLLYRKLGHLLLKLF
jgi:hypothetical protein